MPTINSGALTIFIEAYSLSPLAQPKFIREACQGNPQLEKEVQALLEQTGSASAYFIDLKEQVLNEVLEERNYDLYQSGDQVSKYKILEKWGEGGMAVVYAAERADGAYEQKIALKIMKTGIARGEEARRFRHERQILASLQHPNISRILDGGVNDKGLPFLVMEFIDGLPIDQYCRENQLNLSQKLDLFEQVCEAVSFAHQNLIVHRDLKPSNILVNPAGRVKLTDFGIAKFINEDPDTFKTQTGLSPLSPRFSAPEQLSNGVINTQTDVYQLGILLYLLLSETHPFAQDLNFEERLAAMRDHRFSPIHRSLKEAKLASQIKGDLETIVGKALRCESVQRYASVAALQSDIHSYRTQKPISARPLSTAYRLKKYAQRNKTALLLSSLILLLSLAFSFIYVKNIEQEKANTRLALEKAQAETQRAKQALYRADLESERANKAAKTTRIINQKLSQETSKLKEANQRVLSERDRAEQASFLAQKESRKSKEVLDFIIQLFYETSPNNAQGDTLNMFEVLARGHEKLETKKYNLEAETGILRAIAEVYRAWDHPKTYSTYQKLLQNAQQLYGIESELYLETLIESTSSAPKAKQLEIHLKSIAHIARYKGKDNDYYIMAQIGLGIWYELYGKFPESEKAFQEAYAHFLNIQSVCGEFAIYQSFAKYWGKKNDPRADRLFQRASELIEKNNGYNTQQMAHILREHANFLVLRNQFERAHQMHQKSIAIYRKIFGDYHYTVAHSLNAAGLAFNASGNFHLAIDYFRQSAQIREKLNGSHFFETIKAYYNLAVMYYKSGQFHSAIPALKKILRDRQEHDPNRKTSIFLTRYFLAESLRGAGKLAEAEHHFQTLAAEVQAYQKEVPEDPNARPFPSLVKGGLAQLHEEKGDIKRALSEYQEADKLAQEDLPGHPFIPYNQIHYAYARAQHQQEYASAKVSISNALQYLEENYPGRLVDIWRTKLFKAYCLWKLGELQNAKKLMKAVANFFSPDNHPQLKLLAEQYLNEMDN